MRLELPDSRSRTRLADGDQLEQGKITLSEKVLIEEGKCLSLSSCE